MRGVDIYEAVTRDRREELTRIIKDGGDPNTIVRGNNILRWAMLYSRWECAVILVNAKADVNISPEWSPLHQASLIGSTESERICLYLLQHGADIHALDRRGNTALHWASRWGHIDTIHIFVASGASADIDRFNNEGFTPLALCLEIDGENEECAEVLMDYGAKLENVHPGVSITSGVRNLVSKRRVTKQSVRILNGVLRNRFRLEGPLTAFLNGRIPKDVVNLITSYAWATRLDPDWWDLSDSGQKRKIEIENDSP